MSTRLLPRSGSGAIGRETVANPPLASPRVRVVVAGWLNSPHVTGWATMLGELGYDVVLVGHRAPGWPATAPPEGVAACEELTLGRIPLARAHALGRDLGRVLERVRPALVHAHWLPEYGWLAARAGVHPLVGSAWGSDVLVP